MAVCADPFFVLFSTRVVGSPKPHLFLLLSRPAPPLSHLTIIFAYPPLPPPLHSGVEHTLDTTRASVGALRERYDRQELAAASASASASAVHARGGRRAARQREEEERAEEVALVDVVRQKRQTKCVLKEGGEGGGGRGGGADRRGGSAPAEGPPGVVVRKRASPWSSGLCWGGTPPRPPRLRLGGVAAFVLATSCAGRAC